MKCTLIGSVKYRRLLPPSLEFYRLLLFYLEFYCCVTVNYMYPLEVCCLPRVLPSAAVLPGVLLLCQLFGGVYCLLLILWNSNAESIPPPPPPSSTSAAVSPSLERCSSVNYYSGLLRCVHINGSVPSKHFTNCVSNDWYIQTFLFFQCHGLLCTLFICRWCTPLTGSFITIPRDTDPIL